MRASLVTLARDADCQLVMVPRVGDYVPSGATIVAVHAAGGIDEDKLIGHMSFATERTPEQDLAFGFRQLIPRPNRPADFLARCSRRG